MSERLDRAIQRIERERARLLQAFQGLAQEQLDFKPAPRAWSVGEVVHHVGLAEKFIVGDIRQLVSKGPERGATKRIPFEDLPFGLAFIPDSLLRLPFVLAPVTFMVNLTPRPLQSVLFANRLVKLRHAPRMDPRPGMNREELGRFLDEMRRTTLETLEGIRDWDLTRFRWRHPLIGNQDIYGLLELMASHEQRHLSQIEDVKRDTRFPRLRG